jgi:hypothetical protein
MEPEAQKADTDAMEGQPMCEISPRGASIFVDPPPDASLGR